MDSPAEIATVDRKGNLKEEAFKRMGIKPGICKRCGGPTIIIEIITNRYLPRQRAPPSIIKEKFTEISLY